MAQFSGGVGEVTEHKMRAFIFLYNFLSETFLIVRIRRDNVNVHSCQILMALEFSQQIIKKINSNLMKISPVRAKLFHADGRDGQTDRNDEAKSCLAQFCELA